MEIFASGNWRNIRRGEVLIGGAWRRLTRIEIYRSGAWRQAATFTSPLSLTANNVTGRGYNRGLPATIVSTTSQATPTGGLGPYSYSWAVTSGFATAIFPSMAATTFREEVPGDSVVVSTARVTCTDVLGTTATADITITLTNGTM